MSEKFDRKAEKHQNEFSLGNSIYDYYQKLEDYMNTIVNHFNIGAKEELLQTLQMLKIEIGGEKNWNPALILDYQNILKMLIQKYNSQLYKSILNKLSENDKRALQSNGAIIPSAFWKIFCEDTRYFICNCFL